MRSSTFFSNIASVCFLFLCTVSYAKKIVVTGGAGFIGSHVAERLLQRGDSVVIIDNYNDAYPVHIKKKNIEYVRVKDIQKKLSVYNADIQDKTSMQLIFAQEQPDLICHLAARAGVRPSIENPYVYIETNITGTCVILDMAREFNIKHCVCASSSSVYGARYDTNFFSENDPVNQQLSPYGMTKRADELLTYVYHYLFGISITNLRFFTVYGPRGRIDMSPFIFLDAINQGSSLSVYGDGAAVRDFTYVDDIVDGIIRALDTPLGYEIINLGRGEPIVLSHFIEIIEMIAGKKADIEYVSSFSGDVPRTCANVSKAHELLGYTPSVSIEQGMRAMHEWYMQENMVHTQKRRILFTDDCEE